MGDAGNFGKRLNNHGARDTWEISTDGSQVCARRTDRNQGWGMQLKIACVESSEPPPPPAKPAPAAAKVEVLIGSSGPNKKCVDAPVPVKCDVDAGDFGK